jgi:thioredoxin 1
MKKIIKSTILIAISTLIVSACANSNAKNEQKTPTVGTPSTALAGQSERTAFISPLSVQPEIPAAGSEGINTQTNDTTKSTVISGGTVRLTKDGFLKNVWNYEKSPQQWVYLGNKPAIIDFYADWCGPCKIASPILEEVSYEFAGQITIYKIDTQKEQELAAVFGIRSIPAFLYIPKIGKPTMMAGIARSKEDTKQMFVDNINRILLQGK